MSWVRIHPLITNWPGGGPPPAFSISADVNGTAVVELAWDPQALRAPASYENPLRYYSTDVSFQEQITTANGGSRTVSVPAQTITLTNNRAAWSVPDELWAAYVEETLKNLGSGPGSAFANVLFYRVRFTPTGSTQATVWPTDDVLSGPAGSLAPQIGILTISATPSSQVIPDMEAVNAMGPTGAFGTDGSKLLLELWRNLPESDPNRQVLAAMFAHPTFTGASVPVRASLLKLWLLAGKNARRKLPALLDRQTVVGSNVLQPVVTKQALRGTKTLAESLIELASIIPHASLVAAGTGEGLVNDVLTEILDPNGQVNQGAAGTCSPTSIQTLLITVNPAEYARLMVGLLSTSASATLADGSVVDVPSGYFGLAQLLDSDNQPFLVRTYSELAFQVAMLRHGQGARFPSGSGADGMLKAFIAATVGGFTNAEAEATLESLFGVAFKVPTVNPLPTLTTAGTPAVVASQNAVRDQFLGDLVAKQQQVLLHMYWGPQYTGGHAVLAVRREGGAVVFKNPQYPGSRPVPGASAGGTAANPPRRYVDPSQSLESMTEADLANWIISYFVPDVAII